MTKEAQAGNPVATAGGTTWGDMLPMFGESSISETPNLEIVGLILLELQFWGVESNSSGVHLHGLPADQPPSYEP